MIILWPIAGKGSRFINSGYKDLKPFIEIKNKTMLEIAISSIGIHGKHYVIADNLSLDYLKKIEKIKNRHHLNLEVIELKQETRGQAETCYLGLNRIIFNPKEKLIISNCDQYTPWNHSLFNDFINNNYFDAVVTTYEHRSFKINETTPYSHLKVDKNNFATELKEKKAISNLSLNGIYYWKEARYFLDSAKKLIEKNTNEEKYVSLTLNYMIDEGLKVSHYKMKKNEFYSLGTPEDIQKNEENIPL